MLVETMVPERKEARPAVEGRHTERYDDSQGLVHMIHYNTRSELMEEIREIEDGYKIN